MKKIEKFSGWFVRFLPYFVLAAAYVVTVGVFALYGQHNLDADMSSEMVLANLLNEEGSLLSSNWYYSTEIRIISFVPLYQIGLLLFDSWHMARTFAVAVSLALMMGAVIYMARGAKLKDAAIYSAAAIALPISRDYWLLFLYGGWYMAHFTMVCFIVGLILRLDRSKGRVRRMGLLSVACVLSGMVGVRYLMILGAPLLAASLLLYIDEARLCGGVCKMKNSPQQWILLGSGTTILGLVAGYVINSRILSQHYAFQSQDNTRIVEFTLEKLFEQFEYLLVFFGYNVEQKLLSVEGAAAWATLVLLFFLMISVYVLLSRFAQDMDIRQRMIPLFAACAMVIGMLLTTTTDRGINGYNPVHAVVYYIAGILMMVITGFMLLEMIFCKVKSLRQMAMLLLSAVFLLIAGVNVKQHYRSSEANYEDAADWLVQNGYTQGITTFWNGNLLIEASDGQLDMYALPSWAADDLHYWLQEKAHFENLPEGKVFVYVDLMQEEWDPSPCADEARLVYESVGGRAYAYDSAQEVMDIQRRYRAKLLANRETGEE